MLPNLPTQKFVHIENPITISGYRHTACTSLVLAFQQVAMASFTLVRKWGFVFRFSHNGRANGPQGPSNGRNVSHVLEGPALHICLPVCFIIYVAQAITARYKDASTRRVVRTGDWRIGSIGWIYQLIVGLASPWLFLVARVEGIVPIQPPSLIVGHKSKYRNSRARAPKKETFV